LNAASASAARQSCVTKSQLLNALYETEMANKTAIVGVGTANYHQLYRGPDRSIRVEQVGVEVLRAALDDAGLRVADVDGLITSAVDSYPNFACQSGLRDVRFLVPYPMSGRMCAVALAHAAMAIEFDLANCVALVYATNQKSAGMRYGGGMGEGGGSMYDSAYGNDLVRCLLRARP